MNLLQNNWKWLIAATILPLTFTACKKDSVTPPATNKTTITVQNVLNSSNLVESGTFQGTGTPPVILPGQTISFRFSASIGQAVTFSSMYGWSNDLFFAPANPGIALYDQNKKPIEGDVSAQIKLWDNGTRVNQAPGANVVHPGIAENNAITEVSGKDAQGNTYLPASSLVKATLKYEGDSYFTLTLQNTSGGTANETPLSPGVWAVSYIAGGKLLNPAPIFTSGQPTANGLTQLAEAGNNAPLYAYIKSNTGIFTPLSPILVVVYNGIDNPIFKTGEKDRNEGLKELAQQGNATLLAAALQGRPGVKNVYVLPAPNSTVLLPMIGNQVGGSVSQELSVAKGDRIAIATMYGFSNDWFFASSENGSDATQTADISSSIKLYDNGTAVDQFPGAGNNQFNLGGATASQSNVIAGVPNPNPFTTLPAINDIIKVKINVN
ncbi:spondin domain-containing protein [Pedobacter sp. UYP1]|uniref:spondin domain-containing protein n=1 Tax=Pedobacter sp. UYP1 TaxID=1756396 RepID=UPI003394F0DD